MGWAMREKKKLHPIKGENVIKPKVMGGLGLEKLGVQELGIDGRVAEEVWGRKGGLMEGSYCGKYGEDE